MQHHPFLNSVRYRHLDKTFLNEHELMSSNYLHGGGTEHLSRQVFANASPDVIQMGEQVQLTSVATGGTGIYISFVWSGPNGFSSNAQNPAPFTLQAPGAYTYTVTVTDAIGLVASDTVTVVVGEPLNSVLIKHGGIKYQVFASSADEAPRDNFRVTVWGLILKPGDRIAFRVNGVAVGDLASEDGLVLDPKGRAVGQMGVPPHVFTNCRMRYQAKKRKLLLWAAGGWANTAGASVVQAASGTADGVPVVVLVDRAPADGIIDSAAIVPLQIKVKVQAVDGATVMESGKGSGK